MASIGQALAALIGQTAVGEVQPSEQYSTFPNFLFPVTQDSLATDDRPAAFDFAHRVNMIADQPPVFAMGVEFLWQIYRRILKDKILPAFDDPQRGYARRFADAEAQMGNGELTPTLINYFISPVSPADITDTGNWTTATLGADEIVNLATALPPREREWMARFKTLSVLGEDLVESISFERMVLVVLRPWYDPTILGLRCWKFDGPEISDGEESPKGLLPGVATKLILVRNFKIKLSAARMPDVPTGISYRRIGGAAEPPSLSRAAQLIQVSAANIIPTMLAKPLRSDGGPVTGQIASMAADVAAETGARPPDDAIASDAETAASAPDGSQRFHVPFSFDTSSARSLAQTELDAANGVLAARQSEHANINAQCEALRQEIQLIKLSGAGRHSKIFGRGAIGKLKVAQKRVALGALETALAAAQDALAVAQQEQFRAQKAIDLLAEIELIDANETAYVLCLICDRVPKAPNPDPALFEAT